MPKSGLPHARSAVEAVLVRTGSQEQSRMLQHSMRRKRVTRRSPRLREVAGPTLVAVAVAVATSACTSGDGIDLGTVGSTVPTVPTDPAPTVSPPTSGAAPDPELPVGPRTVRAVYVNDVALDDGTIESLDLALGSPVTDGLYWYDPVLGAVGYEGGPTAGFLAPGLLLGGPLAADASAGTTGVFLNGRELPFEDLAALEQLFGISIPPDRYFLDAQGYYGYEGEPPLGNVFDVVAQQSGGGGYTSETAGGWVGGDGDDGYYFDPDSGCSVMSDGVSC